MKIVMMGILITVMDVLIVVHLEQFFVEMVLLMHHVEKSVILHQEKSYIDLLQMDLDDCPGTGRYANTGVDQKACRTGVFNQCTWQITWHCVGADKCGDGIRNGSPIEECDRGDDAACVNACKVNCTCP